MDLTIRQHVDTTFFESGGEEGGVTATLQECCHFSVDGALSYLILTIHLSFLCFMLNQ